MWLSKVTIQVWPSGGELAVAVAPITPAAPGLFSTTICQPVFSPSLAAMMRAIGSVPPPGGNGTMNLIGPFGQLAWSLTRGPQRAAPMLAASTTRRRITAIRASLMRLRFAASLGPVTGGRQRPVDQCQCRAPWPLASLIRGAGTDHG